MGLTFCHQGLFGWTWSRDVRTERRSDRVEPARIHEKFAMTYEYACTSCANEWELEQSIKDDAITECPKCHQQTAKRQISRGTGFILKGSGWYADAYSGSSNKSGGGSTSGGSASTSAETKSSEPTTPSTSAGSSDSSSSSSSSSDSSSSSSTSTSTTPSKPASSS